MSSTPKLPKVLIIDNSLGVTGAFKSIFNATQDISGSYGFIYAVDVRSNLISWLKEKNKKIKTFNYNEIQKSLRLLFYLPQLLINAQKLKKFINKEKIDIVHINDLYNMLGVVLKILYPAVKVVYHIRLLPDSYVGKLYYFWVNLILKYADKVICVSNAVQAALPANSKSVVIYDSFYDKEKFSVKSPNLSRRVLNILYLGNFIKGKGQDLALEAFFKAYSENNNLRLKFVGGDLGQAGNRMFRQGLVQKVIDAGLDRVVSFEDFNEYIEDAIKSADIVLNFSESESFSMVCLETLYFGTPLIASDCGGPREIFEHNKSGLLVPNKDVQAMAEAILKLASDKELQQEFKINGRQYVREKFSPQKTSLQLRQLYNSLL